jgi:hypothetical protein
MAYEEYQPTPLQPPRSIKAEINTTGGATEYPYDQKGEYRTSQKFNDPSTPIVNKIRNNQPYNPSIFTEVETIEGEPTVVEKIKFATGYVIERLVQDSALQIRYVPPSNNTETFPIAADDAFYVEFAVNSQGEIIIGANSPKIIKAAIDTNESRHYPEVGAYAGSAGKYLYKLCEIKEEGENLVCKRFHCGDNIHHIIERVRMINLSNEDAVFYTVLNTYDVSDDTISYRSLEQLDTEGVEVISPTSSGANSIAFRRVKERSDYTAQVKVSEDQDAILVQGNGNDGSLVWNSCDEEDEPVTLLSWEDGLITSESNSFQAGCLEAILPSGVRGDILYHDGANWVILNKPVAATTHVLAITGDIPYWLETEECDESPPP